jgi:hypothetical protein
MRGVTFVARSLMALVVVGLITSCTDGPTAPERSTPAVSLAVGQAATGETITTDKDDYVPGEAVVITGSGWQAEDSVDFVMTEEPATHEPHTWTVGVDEAGGFLDDHFVVQDHDLGVTFTLTATSRATGAVATAVFTDGTVTAAPLTVKVTGTPCGAAAAAFALGDEVCVTTTITVQTVGGGPDASLGGFKIQWLDKDGIIVNTDRYASKANGFSTEAKYTPLTSGNWTVRSCKGDTGDGCGVGVLLDSKPFTVTAPPANQPPTVDAEKDASPNAYDGNEGSAIPIIGDASDPDGDNVTTTWSYAAVTVDAGATCTFGDENALSTTVTCTDDGSFTLTLSATDGKIATPVTSTATLTVSNVAPSAVLSPTSKTINEGGTASYTAVITDPGSNDAVASYAWTPATGACTVTSSTQTSATYTCTDDYDAKVRLTVKDDDDGEGYGEADLKSNNVAPSITSLSVAPALVKIGDPVTLSATFADPGTGDTFTGSTINWDDGSSTDNATVSYNTGTATGTASKTHTYSAAGIYEVSLTILDDDTGSDTKTFQYVVVYDPTAGFVTGGGWINSPQGACRLDACTYETVGKANFGFVSKYLKGANTPTGNTEFQFHAGGLNFSSTSYQWLVVQGSNKATYKGAGTVNGVGGYKFLIYAYDGGSSNDQFRIKIWTESVDGYGNTIENVAYDNQMGQSIDANAGTVIAGGSIVIHK